MMKEWKDLWKNKAYLTTWALLLLSVLITLQLVCWFLIYNEERSSGLQLNDIILGYIPVADVSLPLFSITWICIIFSLPITLRTPRNSIVVFVSIIVIAVLRTITLYLVPLQPPLDIIPLRDPFLEGSFYDNKVMVRDLFFSGHTANLSLLFFLMDIRWIKIAIGVCTLIAAFLLLKQHVHYTIDILVAPFFAYLAYRVGTFCSKYLHTVLTDN